MDQELVQLKKEMEEYFRFERERKEVEEGMRQAQLRPRTQTEKRHASKNRVFKAMMEQMETD